MHPQPRVLFSGTRLSLYSIPCKRHVQRERETMGAVAAEPCASFEQSGLSLFSLTRLTTPEFQTLLLFIGCGRHRRVAREFSLKLLQANWIAQVGVESAFCRRLTSTVTFSGRCRPSSLNGLVGRSWNIGVAPSPRALAPSAHSSIAHRQGYHRGFYPCEACAIYTNFLTFFFLTKSQCY